MLSLVKDLAQANTMLQIVSDTVIFVVVTAVVVYILIFFSFQGSVGVQTQIRGNVKMSPINTDK